MATSQYFNNYGAHSEQRLIEDIIVESIKIMGFDAYYLPNDNDAARDLLFGEDPIKKFKSAFPLELYLSNSTEYMGEKEFFSKFGLEIRNNVNVILSKRSFSQRVPQNTFTRPREGDLVYIPFLNGTGELYEIKFTNQTKDFFMLGRKVPYFYELELEKFKYSQEIIETGVDIIDQVSAESAYNLTMRVIKDVKQVYTSDVWSSALYSSYNIIINPTNSNFANTISGLTAGDIILIKPIGYSGSITANIISVSAFGGSNFIVSTDSTIPGIYAVLEFDILPNAAPIYYGYGSFVDNEILYQSGDGTYANSSAHGTLSNWSPSTGEISLVNIKGEFANNTYIYGATSNSKFYIYNLNELGSSPKNENFDNLFIEESASKYVDKTITNPFGTL
jgi:hypothetical protein